MHWSDEGIVVGTRRHGESNAIIEVMTRQHGRHLGLVRGGAGSRQRPILQPGNSLHVEWRARLDEHLGHYTVEGLKLRTASLLVLSHAIYGVTHLSALCRLLPERDPHPAVHKMLEETFDRLDDAGEVAMRVVRFEMMMLGELGFGLDLESCAATGSVDELDYVSPKSGRAVSRTAGIPWQERLLRLPAFLRDGTMENAISADELRDGFALTGFFLIRHVLEPRGLVFSDARQSLMSALDATRVAARGG
jgi:DNA repair protein RecO (recombination protein O)